MNIEAFVNGLPELYHGWGTLLLKPRSDRFARLLHRVQGLTTPSVLQLLNHAVSFLEAGEVYAEVGTFRGATLTGALLEHPEVLAYAADNFSQFDPGGVNREALHRHLQELGMLNQVRFSEADFEDVLPSLWPQGVRFGVYLYDGGHDYRSQLLGLLLAEPLFSERSLIVVDDSNFTAVRQATLDFLAVRPQARILLDLPTPGNNHPSWWNGLILLEWQRGRTQGTPRDVLRRQRQGALLESLSVLEQVSLRLCGDSLQVTRIG